MEILDIHTHHPAPQPNGVVDVSFMTRPELTLLEGQLYSAGIHPWDTRKEIAEEDWQKLEELLRDPRFVAVGEAGVDLSGRGGMMFRQLQVFRRQIELSEQLHKPLIVHCVKAEDVICGLIRDLRPTQPWVIHGFRKKPAAAEQLLRAGCYISMGEHFNPDTLAAVPRDRLLAETDESPRSIEEIIDAMSTVTGADLRPAVSGNASRVLGLNDELTGI